ncbi:MAG: proteasome accessory factor [Actinomycetota bacterium]|jgi:predicted DNA-binding transcriptional regulator YafY|nr:proteasome accessory factor [Actinomycetota bacterium]
MHRLERLINLVAALLEAERPLTIDELRFRLPGYAESDPAFRRAFERDKEALRELGVPLVTEPLDPLHPDVLGYRVPKDAYYLRDPGLEPDELAALHLAASAVRMEGADGVAALWKLGGELAEQGPAPAVGSVAVAALPGADHLAALFGAISARRPVAFAYHGRPRRVDPWRLSFRTGHWYLAGFDHGAGAERSYRLDRVESEVTPAGEAGSFPPAPASPAAPQAWEMGEGEPVVAQLLVDVDQAGWAVGFVGAEAVEERRGDGSVVLAISVTNRPAFRSFVLGFLDHAQVLGPAELRAEMVEWLEAQCGV